MTFVDPPEPPEGGGLKANDLKNKVCLLRPVEIGEWPAKPEERDESGNVTKKAQGPRPYYECDVWVLDRAGIVEEASGVRISWWRAVEQLKDSLGQFVLAMPVEQDDRSVILVKTAREDWRKVGAEAVAFITSGAEAPVTVAVDYDDGEEPF